ncbi:MAG TPA: prolipoprotein diacylglyceryl transferase [Acidimicrobiia bacterium]|nr:prolipoprotein diacylglyceryl transferase [Acidimicrobiia bacterium]
MIREQVGAVVASIPSPSDGDISIGPLELHAYGLMLAIGVLVALKVAEWRYARYGRDPVEIDSIAVWIIVAGVIGARVYHLFTGYDWDEDGVVGAFKIWTGGLSIWGAVLGGFLAVVVLARRRNLPMLVVMDAISPGLVLAQAIGRWGNWFNQELYGRPTDLPWALEIDLVHRPTRYIAEATFHPTFLYESLYCLVIFAVLLLADRRWELRRGQTFALYIALYTFGRFWLELLRVDPASELLGVRFNALVSAALCVFGIVWFLRLGRHGEPVPRPTDGTHDVDERTG